MECRIGCGACCIAPSISSPIPGMPDGKSAGVRCIQLTSDNRCQLFNEPARPLICRRFEPDAQTCGQDNAFAMHYLARLERDTAGC